MASSVTITVVYSAGPRTVCEATLNVPPGCAASQARDAAALLWGLQAQTLYGFQLGVWGKPVAAQQLLKQGDRLELYRTLTVDPKVARRERFVRQGSKGAGLFAARREGGKAGY